MLAEMLVRTSPVVAWFFSLKGLCWWEAGGARDLAWIPSLRSQNSSRGRGETNKWGVSLRYWSPDKNTHRLKWCESRLLLSLWYYLSNAILITAGAEPCKFGPQWEKRDVVWSQLSRAILKFMLASRLRWLFRGCWWPPGFVEFSRIKEVTCNITQWRSFPLKKHLDLSLLWIHVNFAYFLLMYLWSCWGSPTWRPVPAPGSSESGTTLGGSLRQDWKYQQNSLVFRLPSPHRQIRSVTKVPLILFDILSLAWAVCFRVHELGGGCSCSLQRRHFPAGISQVRPWSTRILKPFVSKCVFSLSTPISKCFPWFCQDSDAREAFLQSFL